MTEWFLRGEGFVLGCHAALDGGTIVRDIDRATPARVSLHSPPDLAGVEDGASYFITLYLIVSFAMAWAIWVLCGYLGAHGTTAAALIPIVILGSFGPFVAAGACAAVAGGWRGVARFYGRAFQWHMGWPVFVISVVALPMLSIIIAALFDRTGAWPAFNIGGSDLPVTYLWLFFLGGPVGEEFGWSYLSDALDTRFGVRMATLILGVVWAIWHLPLFVLDVPGLSQRFIPFIVFLAMTLATRFVFSWAYHRGGHSILSNLLIHNSLNLSFTIVVVIVPDTLSGQPRLWCLSALSAILAALLWWRSPPSVAMPGARSYQSRQ